MATHVELMKKKSIPAEKTRAAYLNDNQVIFSVCDSPDLVRENQHMVGFF